MWPSVHVVSETIVPLANVVVFLIVQSLFFWMIGTKEVLHVVQNKARMISQARAAFRRTGQGVLARGIDTALLDADTAVRNSGWDPEVEARHRTAVNLELMRTWLAPMLLGTLTALLVCVVVAVLASTHRFQRPGAYFNRGHTAGLILVFFGYIGELLLFFLVIKQYIMVGDIEVIRTTLGVKPKPA